MAILKAIIQDVLDEMAPGEVDPKYKYQTVFGRGYFKCSIECENGWSSRLTWVTVDLQEERVAKRFGQKCKKCKNLVKPRWRENEFEEMMYFAVKWYLKQVKEKAPDREKDKAPPDLSDVAVRESNAKAPHETWLCEKCKFGRRPCWKNMNRKKKKKKKKEQSDTSTCNTQP